MRANIISRTYAFFVALICKYVLFAKAYRHQHVLFESHQNHIAIDSVELFTIKTMGPVRNRSFWNKFKDHYDKENVRITSRWHGNFCWATLKIKIQTIQIILQHFYL